MADKYINIGGHKITADKEMETGTFSGTGTNISVDDVGSVYYKKDKVVFIVIRWTAVTNLTSGTSYSVATNLPVAIRPKVTVQGTGYLAGYQYSIYLDENGVVNLIPRVAGISSTYRTTYTFTYLAD